MKKQIVVVLLGMLASTVLVAGPAPVALQDSDPEAQLHEGLRYYTGDGVPRDAQEAFAWISLSASHGHGVAQLMLADMYMTGDGCRKNDVLAYLWLVLASLQQQHGAEERLGELFDAMDPQDRAAATSLVDGWLGRHALAGGMRHE